MPFGSLTADQIATLNQSRQPQPQASPTPTPDSGGDAYGTGAGVPIPPPSTAPAPTPTYAPLATVGQAQPAQPLLDKNDPAYIRAIGSGLGAVNRLARAGVRDIPGTQALGGAIEKGRSDISQSAWGRAHPMLSTFITGETPDSQAAAQLMKTHPEIAQALASGSSARTWNALRPHGAVGWALFLATLPLSYAGIIENLARDQGYEVAANIASHLADTGWKGAATRFLTTTGVGAGAGEISHLRGGKETALSGTEQGAVAGAIPEVLGGMTKWLTKGPLIERAAMESTGGPLANRMAQQEVGRQTAVPTGDPLSEAARSDIATKETLPRGTPTMTEMTPQRAAALKQQPNIYPAKPAAPGTAAPDVTQPPTVTAPAKNFDDRLAIQTPDGSVYKSVSGEFTHDEMVDRLRSSIAKQFEKVPSLRQKFDAEFFDPKTQFGHVDKYGQFYREEPTAPAPEAEPAAAPGAGAQAQPTSTVEAMRQFADAQAAKATGGIAPARQTGAVAGTASRVEENADLLMQSGMSAQEARETALKADLNPTGPEATAIENVRNQLGPQQANVSPGAPGRSVAQQVADTTVRQVTPGPGHVAHAAATAPPPAGGPAPAAAGGPAPPGGPPAGGPPTGGGGAGGPPPPPRPAVPQPPPQPEQYPYGGVGVTHQTVDPGYLKEVSPQRTETVGAVLKDDAQGAVKRARQRAKETFGDQYQGFYGPVAKDPLKEGGEGVSAYGPRATMNAARAARQELADNNIYSNRVGSDGRMNPQVDKALEDLELADPATRSRYGSIRENAAILNRAAKGRLGYSQAARMALDAAAERTAANPEGGPLTRQIVGLRNDTRGKIDIEGYRPLDPEEMSPLDVQHARGLFNNVTKIVRSNGTSPIEARALMKAVLPLRRALDNAIPPEQLPALQRLNANYSNILDLLGKGARGQFAGRFTDISKAASYPHIGDILFDPKMLPATDKLIDAATAPEREIIGHSWLAHVMSMTEKGPLGEQTIPVSQQISELQKNAPLLKKLWPNSDLGKVKTWLDVMNGTRRYMSKPPPNFPDREKFMRMVLAEMKKNGITTDNLEAVDQAGQEAANARRGPLDYSLKRWMFVAPFGYGVIAHNPIAGGLAVAYLGLSGASKAFMNNPAALEWYLNYAASPSSKATADLTARIIGLGVNEILRQRGQPEGQAPGLAHQSPVGPAMTQIAEEQARQIAPSPGSVERAGKLSKQISSGKVSDVQGDLRSGRLSLDETKHLLQSAKGDLGAQTAGVPLPELVSAAEVGTPAEKQMLVPLIVKKAAQEIPQLANKTLQAKLGARIQRLMQETQMLQRQAGNMPQDTPDLAPPPNPTSITPDQMAQMPQMPQPSPPQGMPPQGMMANA